MSDNPQIPETPADAAALSAQLGAIIDYVRQCEQRVLRGEIMDLSGLDRSVIALCEQVTSLPGAEARTLEARMRQLVEGLDALAGHIRELRDQAGGAGSDAK